ncbi:MAG: hypothetical protein DRI61_09685 [Chloroflexi bacterium]|nr:MAG: hypothetical protein DRI61_09685 [Chloroflexota bacterium]
MSIINGIKLTRDSTTNRLTLQFSRSFPVEYSDDDKFVLEKYDLDLTDITTRRELREVIKSQTVMQYMQEDLMMSASFQMAPINSYHPRDDLSRVADFKMNPEFVDLTDIIKAQNAQYMDTGTVMNHLYLYRMVYQYHDDVYNTDYVAGFERITDAIFTSETTGREVYKTMISDETMTRLFGSAAINLKQYFTTPEIETRTNYRQTPIVFRVPGRRINHRYKGPLEDYKLKVGYHEIGRHISTINEIQDTLNNELNVVRTLMTTVDRRALDLRAIGQKQMVLFTSAIEDIAQGDLYGILVRTTLMTRVLSVDSLAESYIIPQVMTRPGVYVLLTNLTTAEEIYNLLLVDRFEIEEDIYIALYTATSPVYTLEFQYE